MANKPPMGPEHSRDREFTVILEEIRSEFRVFGEGLTEVQKQIGSMSNRLEQLEESVSLMKSILPAIASDIRNIQSTYATKKDLERFATKEDFQKFVEVVDKRLHILESR